MPRKRWRAQLSYHDNWIINPEDRNAVEDHDLVRHALVNFSELADLPDDIREQLVADLVGAIRFWWAGVKPRKRGLSDEREAQHIFFSDVRRALERAGLPATRWRKTHEGNGPDIDAAAVAVAGMRAPPTSVEARDRLNRCSCRRRT
jgi:hypothetical protein